MVTTKYSEAECRAIGPQLNDRTAGKIADAIRKVAVRLQAAIEATGDRDFTGEDAAELLLQVAEEIERS